MAFNPNDEQSIVTDAGAQSIGHYMCDLQERGLIPAWSGDDYLRVVNRWQAAGRPANGILGIILSVVQMPGEVVRLDGSLAKSQ